MINHLNNGCPCYQNGLDCDERHIGCHADCDRYKKWKKKLDEKNENKRKEKARTQTISDSAKRKMWQKQRYKNQQKYRRSEYSDR